jgi:Calcineurin-like phosphoesterase
MANWLNSGRRGGVVLALLVVLLIVVGFVEASAQTKQDSFAEEEEAAFPAELYHSNQEPFRSFPCLPKRIHLAQATNVDDDNLVSMTVSFSLDFATCRQGNPVVVYGHDLQPQGSVSGGKALQFNYTSDESDGLYQSDWIYHVEIPAIRAGLQKYWYRIIVELQTTTSLGMAPTSTHRSLRGSGGYYLGETRTYTFLTPPLPGSPTTLALVGDIGQTGNSVRTLLDIFAASKVPPNSDNDAHSNPPPVSQILIAGDLSYADSDPARWTSWMDLVEPLVRSTPMHVAAGNHEIECDTQTNAIFVPYEHWFRNPNRIAPAAMEPVTEEYKKTLWHHSCSAPSEFQGVYNYGNSFYSYQHGLVHIVVLNSYSDCRTGSVQYQWLESELRKRVDRSKTPWLLVAFHAPLYTTFLGHVNEVEALRMKAAMEPLFVEYGVNLIVSGELPLEAETRTLVRTTGNYQLG